jgi:hypothetical protein
MVYFEELTRGIGPLESVVVSKGCKTYKNTEIISGGARYVILHTKI